MDKRRKALISDLCSFFDIKQTDLECHIERHAMKIIDNDPSWSEKKIKKLNKKHGPGAQIIAFRSMQDFKNGTCTSAMFNVPNDCHFEGGSVYAPTKAMSMLRGQYERMSIDLTKAKYMVFTVIYDNWPKSRSHLPFLTIRLYKAKLERYFLRKKWSATVLRRRCPEYLGLFRSDNWEEICDAVPAIVAPKHQTDASLKKVVSFLIPPVAFMEQRIDDEKKREAAVQIVESVFTQCEQHKDDFLAANDVVMSSDIPYRMKRTYLLMNFPSFIAEAMQKLTQVVGRDSLSRIVRDWSESQNDWNNFVRLRHLIEKIEGRKCAYPNCSNQEDRNDGVIEKYKTCSACRNAVYCSKSCQKRHWVVHRNHCDIN